MEFFSDQNEAKKKKKLTAESVDHHVLTVTDNISKNESSFVFEDINDMFLLNNGQYGLKISRENYLQDNGETWKLDEPIQYTDFEDQTAAKLLQIFEKLDIKLTKKEVQGLIEKIEGKGQIKICSIQNFFKCLELVQNHAELTKYYEYYKVDRDLYTLKEFKKKELEYTNLVRNHTKINKKKQESKSQEKSKYSKENSKGKDKSTQKPVKPVQNRTDCIIKKYFQDFGKDVLNGDPMFSLDLFRRWADVKIMSEPDNLNKSEYYNSLAHQTFKVNVPRHLEVTSVVKAADNQKEELPRKTSNNKGLPPLNELLGENPEKDDPIFKGNWEEDEESKNKKEERDVGSVFKFTDDNNIQLDDDIDSPHDKNINICSKITPNKIKIRNSSSKNGQTSDPNEDLYDNNNQETNIKNNRYKEPRLSKSKVTDISNERQNNNDTDRVQPAGKRLSGDKKSYNEQDMQIDQNRQDSGNGANRFNYSESDKKSDSYYSNKFNNKKYNSLSKSYQKNGFENDNNKSGMYDNYEDRQIYEQQQINSSDYSKKKKCYQKYCECTRYTSCNFCATFQSGFKAFFNRSPGSSNRNYDGFYDSNYQKQLKRAETAEKEIEDKIKIRRKLDSVVEFGLSFLSFCILIYKLPRIELERPINEFCFQSLSSKFLVESVKDSEDAIKIIKNSLLDRFRVFKFWCKVLSLFCLKRIE